MVKACRLAVAPALVARLRDDKVPSAQDVAHVAQAIAGDLQGWPLCGHGLPGLGDGAHQALSLIYARVALFGDERP